MPCYFQRPHHTHTQSLTRIYLWQKRFDSYDILNSWKLQPLGNDHRWRYAPVVLRYETEQRADYCHSSEAATSSANIVACIINSRSCPASCNSNCEKIFLSLDDWYTIHDGIRSTVCKGKLLSTHALTDQATTAGCQLSIVTWSKLRLIWKNHLRPINKE